MLNKIMKTYGVRKTIGISGGVWLIATLLLLISGAPSNDITITGLVSIVHFFILATTAPKY